MQRLAVDIDEVLMPFLIPMAKWKGMKIPKKESYPYLYTDIFNIPLDVSRAMVQDFYRSEEITKIKPIKGSQMKLTELRPKLKKIYAVTGRQSIARGVTEDWLKIHFPDIFDDLVMTNSFTTQEISKVSVCSLLSLDTIIDDSLKTCMACQHAGIKAYHFVGKDVYPWCVETQMTLKNWDELKYL